MCFVMLAYSLGVGVIFSFFIPEKGITFFHLSSARHFETDLPGTTTQRKRRVLTPKLHRTSEPGTGEQHNSPDLGNIIVYLHCGQVATFWLHSQVSRAFELSFMGEEI